MPKPRLVPVSPERAKRRNPEAALIEGGQHENLGILIRDPFKR